ncbi:unnamed protein product [Ectocarpus sp. CCAP 1310/34]|nr:unnamed protein product [Ectocarpus sp. CCAP 1310/34]
MGLTPVVKLALQVAGPLCIRRPLTTKQRQRRCFLKPGPMLTWNRSLVRTATPLSPPLNACPTRPCAYC